MERFRVCEPLGDGGGRRGDAVGGVKASGLGRRWALPLAEYTDTKGNRYLPNPC